MKSDFCNTDKEEFYQKIKNLIDFLDPYLKEGLERFQLSGLNINLIPLPNNICQDCTLTVLYDILSAVKDDRSYLLVSASYQFLDSFLEAMRKQLLDDEWYEGINPIDKVRKNFEEGKIHYIGQIKLNK